MKKYYREIPGYPGYYISKWGRIYSTFIGRHLHTYQRTSNGKYFNVTVHIKKKTRILSRLVALAWVPNPDNKPCVCHKDNNPLNNHHKNLYWGTYKENTRQMFNDRRARPRGKIPLSKKAIGQLVQDYNSGMSRDDLRKKFNLKNTRITRIIRTYSKPKFGNYRNQGKEKLIVKAYIDGMAISEICKKFNIGHTTVNNYRKRFNLPNR